MGDTLLESRLRDHLAQLAGSPLAPEEAFLVAARRVGALDEAVAAMAAVEASGVTSEAAEAHTRAPNQAEAEARTRAVEQAEAEAHTRTPNQAEAEAHTRAVEQAEAEAHTRTPNQAEAAAGQARGVWRWLGLAPEADSGEAKREFLVMGGLACAAAVAVKAPEVFGLELEHDTEFYARNLSLLVLPFLAGYFAWKRRLSPSNLALLAAGFAAAAVFVNAYPFDGGRDPSDTEVLTALHLPILLWLVVGVAHAAGDWRSHNKRIGFVRFTGEWIIYFGLIALGGGVFAGSTAGIFAAIDIDAGEFIGLWLVPCGAAGAVVVAAWLAESRQGALERVAPVLSRLFTPLFTALLVAFLGAMALTGRGIDIGRGVLIFFDVLLALILALVIYSIAVRDPQKPPGLFDALQLGLVVAAVLVDVLVLGAIVSRLSDFGATPNRVAALGENLLLLVNLAWSAWLYFGLCTGRRPFAALERWQAAYAPVFAVWIAAVVVALPLIFGFS